MKGYARAAVKVREQLENGREPDYQWLADEMALAANYFSTASYLCEIINPAVVFKQRKEHEAFAPLKFFMASAVKVEFKRMLDGERVAPPRTKGMTVLVKGILYREPLSPLFTLSVLDVSDWLQVAEQPVEQQQEFADELVRQYLA